MLLKSQVKYIQSLGHKKFRDADGVFVAEGPKIVNELLQSENLKLVKCFATDSWLDSRNKKNKYPDDQFIPVEEKELEKISFHSAPNKVVAIFTKPVFHAIREKSGISILLETIQDPGNLGTIIRTADWFGIKRIVCSPDTVDVFNPKVVQSAMGSLARVKLLYTELGDYIKNHVDIPVFAASLDGENIKTTTRLPHGLLLMGNESKGLSPDLEKLAAKKIRIPGKGGAESLNVAVATGILLSKLIVD